MVRAALFLGVTATLAVLLNQFYLIPLRSRKGFYTGLYILLIQTLLLLVWKCLVYPRFFSPLRHLPQPKGAFPLIGHSIQLLSDPVGCICRAIEEFPHDGLIVLQGVLNVEEVWVTSPAGLAELLVSKCYDFTKPPEFLSTDNRVFGGGILFAEGDVHKRQRKSLMPAFAFRHIKDLYSVFWDQSTKLVRAMVSENTQPLSNDRQHLEVEVCSWASRATLDVIGIAGLGQAFDALGDPQNQLNRNYHDVFDPNPVGVALDVLRIFFPRWLINNIPIQRNKVIQRASTMLNSTCQSRISANRESMKSGSAKNVDILSVAMSSESFVSDEELVDQMKIFLLAGHETTSSAFSWAIYLLCLHPGIQTRLRDEIQSSSLPSPWANDNPKVTSNDIDNLPYLNAVCNEVLRLNSPVPMTVRSAARDTSLLGQTIPKGTLVFLPISGVNVATSLWGPDATTFDPERWLRAKSGGANSHYSMLTFLHGPRGCIGEKFARAELACLLAAWVSAYETSPAGWEGKKEVENWAGITIKPKGGLAVKLRPLRRTGV